MAKKPPEVERAGNQIIVPTGMSLDTAIKHLAVRMDYEEQEIEIKETVNAFVWDGAIAFQKALQELFGWSVAQAEEGPMPGMKGDPPRMLSIQIAHDRVGLVPWGIFTVPGMSGNLQTGYAYEQGMMKFAVTGITKRKYEEKFRAIIQRTREIVAQESIYKGKAFKLRFMNDAGDRLKMPEPVFLDLSRVNPEELVFSHDVTQAVSTSLFTPIEQTEKCREFKIPLKRGVLLYGPYGTGKSLTSYVTAKKCEEYGWTFVYCERADELADAVKLAHHFQPAVVFCEDIDRAVAGERTVKMDDVLNIIDGIESKGVELMVILTTNHVEEINQALLRPGRLDAVINVLPPDAEAVERLIRVYGRHLVPKNADLQTVGERLAGSIPAVIREVVEKAKLSALKIGLPENGKLLLTPEALLDSAVSMTNQLELLNRKRPETRPALHAALGELVKEQVETVWDERN